MRAVSNNQIKRALREVFGIESLRGGQEASVKTILHGRDLLAIMPTGAGKSLCYQLPAVLLPGMAVVVSPLIALMRDQVNHLRRHGVPAVCIDSLQTEEEQAQAEAAIMQGKVKLVYVSPERLNTQRFRCLMQPVRVSLLVVDEAHCVIDWGEDFRPAYREIPRFPTALKSRPVICAMTATADRKMQKQIIQLLQMTHTRRVVMPLLRENLRYSARMTDDKLEAILSVIHSHEDEKGIIFCRTRARCESLAGVLAKWGVRDVSFYHAGLEREERMLRQQQFEKGQLRLICATSAFGMGVDVKDIRYVIHDSLPEDLVDYSQQSGRAGRDGYLSDCVLLLTPRELEVMRDRIRRSKPSIFNWQVWKKWRRAWLDQRRVISLALGRDCLAVALAKVFSQRVKPCGQCSACLRAQMKKKTPLAPVPELPKMTAAELRLWALKHERKALAEEKNAPEESVLPYRIMASAANACALVKTGVAPDVYARMQRLLLHMDGKLTGQRNVNQSR